MPRRLNHLVIACVLVGTLSIGCASQRSAHTALPSPPPHATPAPSTQPTVSQDGPVIPGDLLRLTTTDVIGPGVEWSVRQRVDEHGDVSLPMIGRVLVQGVLLSEVPRHIKRAYDRTAWCGVPPFKVERLESGNAPSVRLGPFVAGEYLRAQISDWSASPTDTVIVAPVREDGTVELPGLGAVHIAGANEANAAERIAGYIRLTRKLRSPGVRVRKISAAEAATQPAVRQAVHGMSD